MRMDHLTKIEVDTVVEPVEETNPTKLEMEPWESKLQTTEATIQCFRQGLRSLDRATILECKQALEDLIEKVYHVGAPKSTNE